MENFFNDTEINNLKTYFGQSEIHIFDIRKNCHYIGKSSLNDLIFTANNKDSYLRKLIDNNIGTLKLCKYEELSNEEKQLVDLVDTNIEYINF